MLKCRQVQHVIKTCNIINSHVKRFVGPPPADWRRQLGRRCKAKSLHVYVLWMFIVSTLKSNVLCAGCYCCQLRIQQPQSLMTDQHCH